jgi:hypothetical protein
MRNTIFLAIVIFTLIALSCSKETDEIFTEEDTQTSITESIQESITDELDDLAANVLNSGEAASGGRVATIEEDDRIGCPGTTIVFSNVASDRSSGTATVSFAAEGCADKRGNIRKGTIVITWSGGKWFRVGAVQAIQLNNYSLNGVDIAGTRSLSCEEASGTLAAFSISWHITASHTLTWPDGTTGIRQVDKIRKWDHTSAEDVVSIMNSPGSEFSAWGTNRFNNSYTVVISTPLKYTVACVAFNKVYIPGEGLKIITQVDKSRTFTMDFGDGTCDKTFTVSVDGRSRTLEARNDGDS